MFLNLIYMLLMLSPLTIIFSKRVGIMALLFLSIISPLITGFTVEISKSYIGFPLSPFELFVFLIWLKYLLIISRKGNIFLFKIFANILYLTIWLLFSALFSLSYKSGDPTVLIRSIILLSTSVPIYYLLKDEKSSEIFKFLNVFLIISFFILLIISIEIGRILGGVQIYGVFFNKADRFMYPFIFVIFLCIFLSFKNLKYRLFYIIITILGITMSQGRAFWFSSLLLIIFYSFINKDYKLLIIIFVLALLLSNILFSFISQRLTLGETSASYRIKELKVILSEVILEPHIYFIGRGLGAIIPQTLAEDFESSSPWWIHNEILLFLYDSGIIGVFLYFLCLISLVRYGIKCNTAVFYYGSSLLIVSLTTGQFLTLLTGPWLGFLLSLKEGSDIYK